jgi:hypothetical protein
MTAPIVETIQHHREFKTLCDGLLRFELGQLIQTYGSDGSDGGVDAEFKGMIDGISGRWVFQYKFRSPRDSISRRRAWLSQCYRSHGKRKSEFDKDGVAAADGYILLTNVPVTVALVDKLSDEWRARQHQGPVCVWDPSRLDALLKVRPYLARSWNGVKEAYCRDHIVLPIWQWLDEASATTANWQHDPLWPLEIKGRQSPFPVRSFSHSFAVRYGVQIVARSGPLLEARVNPQFQYASAIAYPRAMQPFKATLDALRTLSKALGTCIDSLASEMLERMPQLQNLKDASRPEIAAALAYCVLGSRWGFPRFSADIVDGKLMIGTLWASEEPVLAGIKPLLDELVGDAPRKSLDSAVVAARAEVTQCIQDWWMRLWYVSTFHLDAEGPDTDPNKLDFASGDGLPTSRAERQTSCD